MTDEAAWFRYRLLPRVLVDVSLGLAAGGETGPGRVLGILARSSRSR